MWEGERAYGGVITLLVDGSFICIIFLICLCIRGWVFLPSSTVDHGLSFVV